MHYPRHIGIIPDGNRTWAKEQGLPSIVGHKAGFDNANNLIEYIFTETNIEVATMRGASTENIQERSEEELSYLYEIYQMTTQKMVSLQKKHGVGFKWIGSKKGLPTELVEFFTQQEQKYPSKNGKYCILAVNYGGNDEILRGINTFLANNPNIQFLSESQLSSSMDLGDFPPIELVIRTKGKMAQRLSGFMTWWISYAELYFSDKYFPDFTVNELQKVLEWFNSIVEYRNYGK